MKTESKKLKSLKSQLQKLGLQSEKIKSQLRKINEQYDTLSYQIEMYEKLEGVHNYNYE